MKALYTNISDENDAYITRIKDQTGLPKATIVGMIIERARASGWHFEPGTGPAIRED